MPETRATIIIEARDQASQEFKDLTAALTGVTAAIKEQGKTTAKSGEQSKKAGFDIKDLAAGFYIAKNAAAMVQGAIQQLTGETVAYAEQVRDLSRITGSSTEEMSKLIQVADDAKVGAGTLNLAFKMLIRQGIAPNIENLSKLADEYRAMDDPVKKSQFAMEKFGRAGLEMTKILELSGEEIKASAAEAERLGLIMSGPAVEAARDYEKSIDNLQDAMQGMKITIGNTVIPVITKYTDRLNEQISVSGAATQAIDSGAASWLQANMIAQRFTAGLIDQKTALFELAQLTNAHTAELNARAAALRNWEGEDGRAIVLTDMLAKAQRDLTEAIDPATAALLVQRDAMSAIAIGIQGPIGDAQKKYEKSVWDVADAQNALDVLLGDTTPDDEQTAAILRARDALAELEKKSGDAKTAIDDATKALIFQRASADLDAGAALELARSFGLIDEASYNTARAVDELRAKYDTNGIAGIQAKEAANGYTKEVGLLAAAIARLEDKHVAITTEYINIERNLMFQEGGYNSGQNYGGRRAIGGPVSANTPYLVGERGPELFMPSQGGNITPNNQLEGATGGISWSGDLIVNGTSDPQETARMVIRELQGRDLLPRRRV